MHTYTHVCTHSFMQHDDRETPQRRRPNFSRVSRNSDSMWPPQDFRESIGRPRRYSSDERYQRERERDRGRGEREWVKSEGGERRWGVRGAERERGRGERGRGERMREEASWRDRGRGWDAREGGRRWNKSPDRWQHDMFEQLEDQAEEEEGEEEGAEEGEEAQRWR